MTFSIALAEVGYPDQAARLAFWNQLTARLAALPGVEAAGLVSCPPLGCHWGTFFRVEGGAPPAPGEMSPVVLYRPASDGYFGSGLVSGEAPEAHQSVRPEWPHSCPRTERRYA